MARTAHALHILVKSKDKAEDIMKQLKKGAKFQTLARKYSTCHQVKRAVTLVSSSKVKWFISLIVWCSKKRLLRLT
ncbi:peptidyl-prolyl cis-trans isomerase ppiC [Vibrio sp. JCM 19236]|nr:peptidyl-prolyl cis-trans isomerase ppiC [Vibrio sp. JCM 19236]